MKSSAYLWLLIILCLAGAQMAQAQVDSAIGQITSSASNTFTRDISGDGRFVVLESTGDISTERTSTRNNADGNVEIFLFDYAQRRIFQITDTRRVLTNTANPSTDPANVCIDILNTRPALSNDGRWIVFSSNATTSTPQTPNSTNPGSFNGNAFTPATGGCGANPLASDANTEIWLYQIPAVAPVNLSLGVEPPFVNLSAGTFTQATNSLAFFLPVAGNANVPPFISDDNRDAYPNDDASRVAFISNRNYTNENGVGVDNAEVFVFARGIAAPANPFRQITQTPRAVDNTPIFNQNPSLSGSGNRVVFYSNATTPRPGVTSNNADNNGEVFYADLSAAGEPTVFRQVTTTVRTNPSDVSVQFSAGRRISRDGRFIAFETLTNNPAGGGANQNGYGLYVFDANAATNAYQQIGPRGDADPAAFGGDVRRFPNFTTALDPATGAVQQRLVFTSRLNFRPDGTVPGTASEGLNPDANRPVQVFSVPVVFPTPAAVPTLTRVSRFPPNTLFEIQAFTSNTVQRIAFSVPSELGAGNFDNTNEAYYLLSPTARFETSTRISFATGASNLPVGTPSPTPTPTGSPTPTPTTPNAVRGLSPGMIGIAELTPGRVSINQVATGASTARRFELPIELGGVTFTINNIAAGIYSLNRTTGEITFVVPRGLIAGTYPVVLNDNGRISRGTLVIIPAAPDILRRDNIIAAGGRASVFNATNRVLQAEPIAVRSPRLRGGGLVQTRVRVFLTGVQNVPASALTIRIGNRMIPAANILTGAVETDQPGVYSIDFLLPPELAGAGDVPIIITATGGGQTFSSRLDDTAPRLRIL